MNTAFSTLLLNWFDKHGRKDLPWQKNPTPYRVWISEIMLQQTQVTTVIPFFQRFIDRFPDIESLACADQDQVLHLWTGLGYYARARNLHTTAQIIKQKYNGIFPCDFDTVHSLPGIGRSTAGAILALSRQQRHPILDGNVKRVLARYFAVHGWPAQPEVEQSLWQLSDSLTPTTRVAEYTQAIMDLGATLCTRVKPNCDHCPVQKNCLAYKNKEVALFPYSRPSKIKPNKTSCMLMIVDQHHRILLEKRTNRGIWGGLWCFPELPDTMNINAYCQAHFQCKPRLQKRLSSFQHVFSHYSLTITPLLCSLRLDPSVKRENTDMQWHTIDHLQTLGFPAPVKTLITQFIKALNSIKPPLEEHL